MFQVIIKKILYSLLVLWGVLTVVFLLFNILPGDAALMRLGEHQDSASLAAIRRDMGLDRSVKIQYAKYLNDLSPLAIHNIKNPASAFYIDTSSVSHLKLIRIGQNKVLLIKYPMLRRSFQSKRTVSSIISETLPNTFILAFASIVFAAFVGIGLGVLAAIRKDGWFDKLSLVISAFGISLPQFFAAILFGWLFAFVLGRFTGLNLTGNISVVDDFGDGEHLVLKNLILPAFTLGIRPLSLVFQLSRNSMLDVLSQDYIRTARAKGLAFSRVVIKHALRNSLNPVVTALSGWFSSLMAGVIFIEYIFGWKGLGYVMVDALNNYDMPLVLGCVLTLALIFIIVNVMVDICYVILDPRIRR